MAFSDTKQRTCLMLKVNNKSAAGPIELSAWKDGNILSMISTQGDGSAYYHYLSLSPSRLFVVATNMRNYAV